MRLFSHLVIIAVITLLLPGAAWAQGEAPLVPREAFFADRDKEQVQLSPDGKWIGYLALSGGTMNVWVAPVAEPSKASVVTTHRGEPVQYYRWTYRPGQLLYGAPAGKGVHLFSIDLERREPRDLTPADGAVAFVERLSVDHPDEALLRVTGPDSPASAYRRINLRTGASELVFANDAGFGRVLFDGDFRPRVATRRKPDSSSELLKPDGTGSWTPFASFRFGIEADASQPIALDASGKTLYMTDNRGRDTAALKAVELESGKETLLLEDPVADVVPSVLVHPRTGRLQTAVSYYGRLRRYFLDPSLVPDFEYLRTVDRGDIGVPASFGRSLDDRIWLIAFMDGGPTRYYVYDRAARRATFLFTEYKALDGYSLGRRHLEVVTTRDGLQLPADLYLPAAADPDGNGRPGRPLPLLLYVHGGSWGVFPWNDWFINRTLQLLADRGYAVLRVEFRGAGGFGRKVHEAGLGDWGGKMQDDLVDAADWAVTQGITTRDRVGIWGWSYGGYAALEALATSDRFACGMAMYGPTELDLFIDEGAPFAQTAWRHYIGDNTTEEGRALLRRRSPIHKVERIAGPVLIAQGGMDEIVRQGQADRFVAAMQKHKKPVTYVLYPDEPHDLRRSESWVSFFAIAERFFHEHLGGRYEPIGDDLRGSLDVRAGGELIPGLSEAMDRRAHR
jgi:dipeptidyl aminopeptidase/acylaminoacyl peptidase